MIVGAHTISLGLVQYFKYTGIYFQLHFALLLPNAELDTDIGW